MTDVMRVELKRVKLINLVKINIQPCKKGWTYTHYKTLTI